MESGETVEPGAESLDAAGQGADAGSLPVLAQEARVVRAEVARAICCRRAKARRCRRCRRPLSRQAASSPALPWLDW